MGWNGLDLLNDFSPELGDVTGAFKTKVLRWINDGIREIGTSHDWPFLREKGRAVLLAGRDTHSIVLAKPAAPTIAALAGGSLTDGTPIKALITFYEAAAEVESIAGTPSASNTPTGANLSARLTVVPVSTCPLVTERRVYVSVNNGNYQYHGTISDNTTQTYDITTPPTSTVQPPDQHHIRRIDGDLFIEGSRTLRETSVQNLNYVTSGVPASGTPDTWAPVNEEEVRVYPSPSVDTTVSFYYFKRPAKVFGTVDSIPQIPDWLYDDLRRYVMWRGYEYRDRAGKESKQINYENGLRATISKKGGSVRRAGLVRMTTPDSDGRVG